MLFTLARPSVLFRKVEIASLEGARTVMLVALDSAVTRLGTDVIKEVRLESSGVPLRTLVKFWAETALARAARVRVLSCILRCLIASVINEEGVETSVYCYVRTTSTRSEHRYDRLGMEAALISLDRRGAAPIAKFLVSA